MKIFQITVTVKETNALHLYNEGGSGEYNGVEFDFKTVYGLGSPLVKIEGKRYMVDMADILEAICEQVTTTEVQS